MPETIAEQIARCLGEYGDTIADPDHKDSDVEVLGARAVTINKMSGTYEQVQLVFDDDTQRVISIGPVEPLRDME